MIEIFNKQIFHPQGVSISKTVICLMLWCVSPSIHAASQNVMTNQQASTTEENVSIEKVDFHYAIFKNQVIYPDQPTLTARNVRVLLDEDAFSEETLRELFRVLSKAFPTPERLSVEVITNVKQMVTPEITLSNVEPPPEYYNHHGAVYLRAKEVEFFRYTIGPPYRELKTVTLKSLHR